MRDRRMNVGLECRRRTALQVEREILAALAPQPVRQPMGLDGVEALVVQHRIDEPVRRRIAVHGGDDVGAERIADLRIALERVRIGLTDQFRRHVRAVETLGDAMHDRRLQRVVMQNGRIEEGREFRLAPDDLFRLAADAHPYRIDRVEFAARFRLMLGHGHLPRNRSCVAYHTAASADHMGNGATSWKVPSPQPCHSRITAARPESPAAPA